MDEEKPNKPSSYDLVYHCRDCEFMWALGGAEDVCTIGMIKDLPRHPHEAKDFKNNKELQEYDSKVRELMNDDCIINPFNGTCDMNVLRRSK